MKFAVCLYGQPRDYKTGHLIVNNFIKNNSEHFFDFFIHCWCDDNVKLNASTHRYIDPNLLQINNSNKIKSDILDYYKPKSYKFQTPIETFDISSIKQSIMYKNTSLHGQKNIHNILSQMFSRNKVRDILNDYINTKHTVYDMVITMRLDWSKNIQFNLNDINQEKTYVSSMFWKTQKRFIFPDNFVLSPLNVYLKWFNLFKNLDKIVNNNALTDKIKKLGENFIINPEELILVNYLLFNDIKDIVFHNSIGNFY